MAGINLNQPLIFHSASLRYFQEKELHVTRFCEDNVLLLVYEGILRFTEDEIPYEISPGKYHIQKHHTFQKGVFPSDAPKYLYIHFSGEWTDMGKVLPADGSFSYEQMQHAMKTMDSLAYSDASYIEKCAAFYEILGELYRKEQKEEPADIIASYLQKHYQEKLSLALIAEKFNYSKNQVINLFKRRFDTTPFSYIQQVRLQHAQQLLAETSKSVYDIAFECGFNDYSYFYRIFTAQYNVSPTQWRKQKNLAGTAQG